MEKSNGKDIPERRKLAYLFAAIIVIACVLSGNLWIIASGLILVLLASIVYFAVRKEVRMLNVSLLILAILLIAVCLFAFLLATSNM